MQRSNKKILEYLNEVSNSLRRKRIKHKIDYKDLAFPYMLSTENRKYKKAMEEKVTKAIGRDFSLDEVKSNYQRYGSDVTPILTMDTMGGYDMEVHQVDLQSSNITNALFSFRSNGDVSLSRKLQNSNINSFVFNSNIDNIDDFKLFFNQDGVRSFIDVSGSSTTYRYNNIIMVVDLRTGEKRVTVNSFDRNFPALLECAFDKNNCLIKGSVSLKVKHSRRLNGKYKFDFAEGKISARGYLGQSNERSVDLLKESDILKEFYMHYMDAFETEDEYSFKFINGLMQTIFDGFSDNFYIRYSQIKFDFIDELERFICANVSDVKRHLILPEFCDATDRFIGGQMARKRNNNAVLKIETRNW